MYKLRKLVGTEKQILLAETVRDYLFYQLEFMADKDLASKAQKVIAGTSKAKIILNLFLDTYYNKNFIYSYYKLAKTLSDTFQRRQVRQSDFKGLKRISNNSKNNVKQKDFEFVPFEAKEEKTFLQTSIKIESMIELLKTSIFTYHRFSLIYFKELRKAYKILTDLNVQNARLKQALDKQIVKTKTEVINLIPYKFYFDAEADLKNIEIFFSNYDSRLDSTKADFCEEVDKVDSLIKKYDLDPSAGYSTRELRKKYNKLLSGRQEELNLLLAN